jgi:hypothetical protein
LAESPAFNTSNKIFVYNGNDALKIIFNKKNIFLEAPHRRDFT